jgi:hypothetical protein
MRDCTSHRPRDLRPAPRVALRKFRLLVPLLMMLGTLATSDLTSVHAQKSAPVEEKKAPEPLRLEPPPPIPGGPSGQPQQGLEVRMSAPASVPPPQRFTFKIDPKTPLKDLLPPTPKIERLAEPIQGNDLGRVPEVQFEASQGADGEAIKRIAHQIAKINHLNDKKTDGFIEALRSERPDLIGLPFAMGDAWRTKGKRNKQFAIAVATVCKALQPSQKMFWEQYQDLCAPQDKAQTQEGSEQHEMIIPTRIAALTQILVPMMRMHPGLAKYLSTVSHVEATRALARLAIFSADENARKAAAQATVRNAPQSEIVVSALPQR